MGKVIRNFCWHQNFVPKGLSVPALGLYTCIKSFKMCLKSYFKEIVLKLATNGQSDKGFLLTSTFVPKGLSAPALGLYTCIKALKYIPGPGVRWAFTGPLVLWFIYYCCLILARWPMNPPYLSRLLRIPRIDSYINTRICLSLPRDWAATWCKTIDLMTIDKCLHSEFNNNYFSDHTYEGWCRSSWTPSIKTENKLLVLPNFLINDSLY